MNDRDWCVILENLLDNAIEACDKVERKGDVLHYISAVQIRGIL